MQSSPDDDGNDTYLTEAALADGDEKQFKKASRVNRTNEKSKFSKCNVNS